MEQSGNLQHWGNNERRNIDLVRLLCELLDELKPRQDGKSYSEQITFVTDRPGHDLLRDRRIQNQARARLGAQARSQLRLPQTVLSRKHAMD